MAYHVLYRVFEDYLLNPRVLRKTVDVSPLVTIVAVLLGGSLLGVTNALIAVPAQPRYSYCSPKCSTRNATAPPHRPDPRRRQPQTSCAEQQHTPKISQPRPTGPRRQYAGHGDTARKEKHMSGIDKAKDKGQELGGKAKETAGDATGNDDLKAEGQSDQAKGNIKQAGEKLKDVFK